MTETEMHLEAREVFRQHTGYDFPEYPTVREEKFLFGLSAVLRERDEARAELRNLRDKVQAQGVSDGNLIARVSGIVDEVEREVLELLAKRHDEAVRPDDNDNDGLTVKTSILRSARSLHDRIKALK